MKTIPTYLVILVVFTLPFSCSSGEKDHTVAEATNASKKDGTVEMIELIKEATAQVDPMKIAYYANATRAVKYWEHLQNTTDNNEQLRGQMFYANELLKAGKSDKSIMVVEGLLQQLEGFNFDSEDIIYQINKIRALAYIRLGEQNNCIERNNPNRCIMPFTGDGIYEIETSVRTAIGIYQEMLQERPDDFENIWMLNFAYMTLGEYPDEVPAKWRLDEKEFTSDFDLPRFPNIAQKLGISTLGLSGGTCVDDFNNDGFLDIFASSWGFEDQIRFFKSNGDGSFSDGTLDGGLIGVTGGLNITHCDYNNDGWLDVFVLRGAWFAGEGKIPNSLLRNNGDGTFSDVTIEAGLLSYYPTQTAAWADFNLDGWIDVFIGNESLDAGSQFPCELFINNGDGTFTNKIEGSGLQNIRAMTKGVTAGDVNNDGRPDLYLSFLNAKNRLYINNGPSSDMGVAFSDFQPIEQVGEPLESFPCWFWDYDNDGWEDIFVAAFGFSNDDGIKTVAAAVAAKNHMGQMAGGNPRLYKNNNGTGFTDVTNQMGLTDGMFTMGSNFGDIDNDGWLDAYLGTGEPSYSAVVPNKMFRNNGGTTFQDVTTTSGMGHVQKGHGVGFGDFDNDGDQDVFCVIGGAYEGDVFGDALFLNPMQGEKSWVTLILEGTTSNRASIGARVKVTVSNENGEEMVFHRTVSIGGSFGGNSLQLEIGLGDATAIKSIEVKWPNAQYTLERFENIKLNQKIRLKEGSGQGVPENAKSFRFPQ